MKKPNDTKEKLLEVAFNLIWDSSYGAVSVDDICKRAGVNKGSFYHFFASKAELAVESYRQRWATVKPMFDRIFAADVPPLERLRGWCAHVRRIQAERAAQFGHVCGCPYASVGSELATLDETIRASSEELIYAGRCYVESAIVDAMQEGSVNVPDAAVAAQRVYSMCLGMLFEAKVQNSLDVLDGLEPAVMDMIGAKAVSTSLC